MKIEHGSIWCRHQNQIRQREDTGNCRQPESKVQASNEFTLNNPISYTSLGVCQSSQLNDDIQRPRDVDDSSIETDSSAPPEIDLVFNISGRAGGRNIRR